jgi:hypothetical protein
MLELVAMKPLSYFPPLHLAIAERLCRRGLLRLHGERWCLTKDGLELVHRTLH